MTTLLEKITYEDKSNPIPVVTRSEQATAEDFNEIKEVVNNLVDRANLVGAPGFTYIAFASSDTGTGFTLDYSTSLPYIAILQVAEAIETPVAANFAGKWRYLMPEAPKDNTPYVRQNGAWIVLPGMKQMVYTITLSASSDVATRIAGGYTIMCGEDEVEGWTLEADNAVNLLITHNLSGRKIAEVKVWEINGENESPAKPFSDGYAQIVANGSEIKIVGLDTLAVALRIELIFN